MSYYKISNVIERFYSPQGREFYVGTESVLVEYPEEKKSFVTNLELKICSGANHNTLHSVSLTKHQCLELIEGLTQHLSRCKND
jgi:hypothetical protein